METKYDEFEEKFNRFLDNRYPDGSCWTHSDFHCYRDIPQELARLAAMTFLEFEVSDGSLAQVFWRSCPNTEPLLLLCEQGYAMIGAKSQCDAIPRVRILFAKMDEDAVPYIEREMAGDETAVNDWCSNYFVSSKFDLDKVCFLTGPDNAYEIRQKWVEQNLVRLEQLIADSS